MSGLAQVSPPTAPWSIADVLQATRAYLARHHVATPRLDAEVLLAAVLGEGRVFLYTHYDQPLRAAERDTYRALVRRRAAGEPVAYLLGRREFYGRDFRVTRATLVPRPETEHVVEAALTHLRAPGAPAAPALLDVGVGCGTLALTLAAELPQAQVTATDVSAAALAVAQDNAAALRIAGVTWAAGDLFAPLAAAARFDAIVSNPPYVDAATRATLPIEVREYEPATALFAARGGLAVVARLCAEVHTRLHPGGLFACEIGAGQGDAAAALLRAHGPWAQVEVRPDLAGHPRVLVGVRA